eukprot:Lithocolla_globosa_v1_NODE_757_length_3328_cov_35.273755.p4 type:complete len:105 gc:universal NODE_757_length_3328_cov_35.273755:1968-2282(+)
MRAPRESWSKSLGTSFRQKHMLHFQRVPWSTKETKGLMYVRQRRQRTMVEALMTGTGTSSSSWARNGEMTKPTGTLLFVTRAWVEGKAFSVHALNFGLHNTVGD